MFVLSPVDTTFCADVDITVLNAPEPARLLMVYRHMGGKAVRALRKRVEDEGWTDLQVLTEILAGWGRDPAEAEAEDSADAPPWRGPVTRAGEPVPFSAEALAEFCDNYQAAGLEVWHGYLKALVTSRLGN